MPCDLSRDEFTLFFFFQASNSFQSKSSPPCFVSVRVPSAEDLESGRLKFTNREILILRQPCRKGTGRRAAAGEVISLEYKNKSVIISREMYFFLAS